MRRLLGFILLLIVATTSWAAEKNEVIRDASFYYVTSVVADSGTPVINFYSADDDEFSNPLTADDKVDLGTNYSTNAFSEAYRILYTHNGAQVPYTMELEFSPFTDNGASIGYDVSIDWANMVGQGGSIPPFEVTAETGGSTSIEKLLSRTSFDVLYKFDADELSSVVSGDGYESTVTITLTPGEV